MSFFNFTPINLLLVNFRHALDVYILTRHIFTIVLRMILLFSLLSSFIFATRNIDAISCISPYTFSTPDYDFYLVNLQDIVSSLTVSDDNEYCIIRIGMNYHKKIFQLRSYIETDSIDLTVNRQIYFSTHIIIDQGETIDDGSDIWNIIEFRCDYSDTCDRTFALDHLEWLLSTNHHNLVLELRSLFPVNDQNEGNLKINRNILLIFIYYD